MDYSRFTIVLPTLNEERAIGILLRRLLREYYGINVLVVDDGSTDGTEEAVRSVSARNRRVSFFSRKAGSGKGLTASVVDGVRMAKTRFVVVMDADLQHPPEVVGRIARAMEGGADIAVATRAEVKGWELHRKAISKMLIVIGYALLLLRNAERCSDIFSGFFGIRRDLFIGTQEANEGRFVGSGYKVLFDLLKCLRRGSARISEVPYSFGVRKYGESKVTFRHGIYLLRSFLS